MLTEEWGIPINPTSPKRAAFVTFFAFVFAGLIPLSPLLLTGIVGSDLTFILSAIATAFTFAVIGAIRGKISDQSILFSSLETIGVGGVAAILAFSVGYLLREFSVS